MAKLNIRGFSVVAVFAVVILATALALGGYYIWHKNRNNKPISMSASASTNTRQAANGTNRESQRTEANNSQEAVTYLEIKEWDVKLPLSSEVKDAYYAVPLGISKNADAKPSAIIFGLKSLDTTCGVVSSDSQSYSNNLGSIVRALPTDTDPISGDTYAQLYPSGITLGGYYYGYVDNSLKRKTCIGAGQIQTLDAAFSAAIKHAVQNVPSN